MNYVSKNEELTEIPMDISDILLICEEYASLGYNIQNQIKLLNEIGVEESICKGKIPSESIPFIKNFLKIINNNPLFGDATIQAKELIFAIECFELKQISLQKEMRLTA